jgi:hypothetical protein
MNISLKFPHQRIRERLIIIQTINKNFYYNKIFFVELFFLRFTRLWFDGTILNDFPAMLCSCKGVEALKTLHIVYIRALVYNTNYTKNKLSGLKTSPKRVRF